MTLNLHEEGGRFYLTGVTPGEGKVFLGRKYFRAGAHWIGFDDDFAEPIIVRAFYDPTVDLGGVYISRAAENAGPGADPFNYMIGYMQFMQILFRGTTPIPPQVLGGRLADRHPYTYPYPSDLFCFVDFMGPAKARTYGLIGRPFYPYNAMLADSTLTPRDERLFTHPLPNGSLYTPLALGEDDQYPENQSLCASLVGEITPGLITATDVAKYLDEDNHLRSLPVSEEELTKDEPYRIALNHLKSEPLPDGDKPPPEGARPPLERLDESQVAAQAIGEYVLLTLPDPEDFGPTLCISLTGEAGKREIHVHLLSPYDMDSMRADVGREALWRIRQFQIENERRFSDMDRDDAPPGRGHKGLLGRPFQFAADEKYVLELKYRTLAVALSLPDSLRKWDPRPGPAKRMTHKFISGIEWSVLFTWDEDSGLLEPSAIHAPTKMNAIGLKPLLEFYSEVVTKPSAATIDPTNFTLTTMRRDNFAAGRKLDFVNRSDQPV